MPSVEPSRFRLPLRLPWVPAGVRPEESRLVLGAVLTLFGFMVGHGLLETARDALFLARWPAARLPWAYLAIAVFALALSRARLAGLRRLGARDELAAGLLAAALITLLFWFAVGRIRGGTLALYVWSGVLATLVGIRFWTLLGGLMTVTQAKRLFAVVGSGSVLGALVGYGAARLLTEVTAARHLVLAAALVFAATAAAPRLLGGDRVPAPLPEAGPRPPAETWEALRELWDRPYVKRLAVLVLLSAVTFTLVDFSFKAAADRYVATARMGEFFSSVYLSLAALSLVVQLVLVPRAVRGAGVAAGQAAVPGLLLAAAGSFALGGGLVLALLLKGVDGALRHSLHRTTVELLFVPLPAEIRRRVKTLIDVVGQRGGQALASLAIFGLLGAFGSIRAVAAAAVVCCAAWLWLALDLRAHYVDVFRDTLRRAATRTRIEFPGLDAASIEALQATLGEPDADRALAALDILAARGRLDAVPALVLYHPASVVVERALELLSAVGREDVLPAAERLLAGGGSEIAAAALRARHRLRPDEELLRRSRGHPDPAVAVTAETLLLASESAAPASGGPGPLADALAGVDHRLALAFLRAARLEPAAIPVEPVAALARAGTVEVCREAIETLGSMPAGRAAPVLVERLADRRLREACVRSLLGLGPAAALPVLERTLADGSRPHGVRLQVPRALAAFGSPRAAEILQRRLAAETDGMIRFKLLRALGRLRTEHPGIVLDAALLDVEIGRTIERIRDYSTWRGRLAAGQGGDAGRRTPAGSMLLELLDDKRVHAVERLFRLLTLRTGEEDFARIHRGLTGGSRTRRAGSRELVEYLLPPRWREPVLTLLDEPDEADGPHRGPGIDYGTLLAELAASGQASVTALAAYHDLELRGGRA